MAGIKIKRNDKVEVIAGKDKGKQGRVLRVIAEKDRLLVEGVMMIKKHMKPNPQKNIQGGIAEQESTIHISNVKVLERGERVKGKGKAKGKKKDAKEKAPKAKDSKEKDAKEE